jgi:vacuolar iron transporter family protein
LVGGAISMALGEYVSVSSQRDSERALIAKEKTELATMPQEELAELTELYQNKGLSPQTARRVAEELTANDALAAHLDAELNLDQNDIVSPWRAAYASAVAFTIGGLLPILAIIFFPASTRIPATFAAVLLALAITGAFGGYLGGSPIFRPMVRVVVGGALALGATFLIGRLLGTTVLG